MLKRPAGAVLILLLLSLTTTARSESTSGSVEQDDAFADSLASGDFDGDGRADLAVGVPGDTAGGVDEAGVVHVVYGSAGGLSQDGNQVWHQATAGVGGTAEAGDRFGEAVATGDFDGDGFDDLAIGVPFEDVESGGTQNRAGAVNILYGSSEGITEIDDQVLFQEEIETLDSFGRALAAGDFNGDGKDDLAVGSPTESDEFEGATYSGAVDVFDGSASGLSTTSEQWDQGLFAIDDEPQMEDEFGHALAAGNLGAGSHDDLAIGAHTESLKEESDGVVHVLYGSGAGLGSIIQFWHQDASGIANKPEFNDEFGSSLAIGNFGRGRPADLAIGAPGEGVEAEASEVTQAGLVHVLYGSSELGLTSKGAQVWHQSKPGIQDRVQARDHFGEALAAGDFGRSTRADLAIGANGEDLDSESPAKLDAGVVHVLYGSANGVTSSQAQFWHQDKRGVRDKAESGDTFGSVLAAGNFGSGGADDLAVGARGESLHGISDAGAANVLYGTADGLSRAGDQFWHQGVP
jgi:FG-GAP repeat